MGVGTKMAGFARRAFSEKFLRRLDQLLDSTNINFSADEYVGLTLLATIVMCIAVGFVSIFLSLPIPPFLLVPLVAVSAFPALTLWLPRYMAKKRAVELELVLPDALRQVASTLRAGIGIDAALDDIVKSKYGALSDEFERVLTEVNKGRTLENALLALARRSNSPMYERAFRLIVEGIEHGAALASVLDSVAGDIKEVHAIQRERRSATTQQVMFLFAVALFAVPFIIGLTVGVGSAGIGATPTGGGLPAEMVTIAMVYIGIQSFICGLAVGVIRYGQLSKGLSYSIPFVIAATIVFLFAQKIVEGMAAV